MPENSVVEVRLQNIEGGLERLEDAVQKLTEAMVQVVRLDVQLAHNGQAVRRAFDAIESLAQRMDSHVAATDSRLRQLEDVAPINKLISGWVLAWVAGVVGLLAGAAGMKVLGW